MHKWSRKRRWKEKNLVSCKKQSAKESLVQNFLPFPNSNIADQVYSTKPLQNSVTFLLQPPCWGYSKAEVQNTDHRSKINKLAMEGGKRQWEETLFLSLIPTCPGLPTKSHYCPCFLQDRHLKTSPLLQCDWWLIQVYQYSEVSFPWKFWCICYHDRKDSFGWPQPNTTSVHWDVKFWLAAASAQLNPIPSIPAKCFYFRHSILLYRLRCFNPPLQH